MSIPIGKTYTATVSGSMLKTCTCESCSAEYVYQVERQAKGSGSSILFLDNTGASGRAEDAAFAKLEKNLAKAVDPVACPACGFFQKKMVNLLKHKTAMWVSVPLLIIAVIAFVFFLFLNIERERELSSSVSIYAITFGVLGVIGGFVGYFVRDPNKGHNDAGGNRVKIAKKSRGVLRKTLEEEHATHNASLQRILNDALRMSMLFMAGIDGKIDPEEIASVAQIYEKTTDECLDYAALEKEAQSILGRRDLILGMLRQIRDDMEESSKVLYIRAVFIIAASDNDFSDEEWQLMFDIGDALGLSVRDVDEIARAMMAN